MNSAVKSGSRLLSFNNSLSVNKVILSPFLSSFDFSSFSSASTSSEVSSTSSADSSTIDSSDSTPSSTRTSASSSASVSSTISSDGTLSGLENLTTVSFSIVSPSKVSMSFLKVNSLEPSSFLSKDIDIPLVLPGVTSTSSDVFETSVLMSFPSFSPLNRCLRRFTIDIENTPRIIIG